MSNPADNGFPDIDRETLRRMAKDLPTEADVMRDFGNANRYKDGDELRLTIASKADAMGGNIADNIAQLERAVADAIAGGGHGRQNRRQERRRQVRTERNPSPLESPHIAAATPPRLVLLPMADVVAVSVEWLWDARLPCGKLSVLAGDPGLGKSYLALKICAVISCGSEWPDGRRATAANVLIVSAEDDAADTIRPRLDRLGADVSRITLIDGVMNDGAEFARPFSLRLDVDLLRTAIIETAAAVVVVDPLNAFLGGIDSYKAAEVRGVLSPLAHVAAETHAAILAVHHLNKGTSSNALYRAGGSLDFVAAARIVHGVAADPDVEGRRVFVPVKCNIAAMPDGLGFRIGEEGVTFDRLPVTLDAAAAFTTRSVDHDERSERDMAMDFLRDELADGPVPVTDVNRAAKVNGFSERTVRRASGDLHVLKTKSGYQGAWLWSLPDDPDGADACKDSRLGNVATFEAFEPEPLSDVATFDDLDHLGPCDPAEPHDSKGDQGHETGSKGGQAPDSLRLKGSKGGQEIGRDTFVDAPAPDDFVDPGDDDPEIPVVSVDLFTRAVAVVVTTGAASEPLIAKRCDCSPDEAAATVTALEQAGVVGAANGSKARDVLIGEGDAEGLTAAYAARYSGAQGAEGSDPFAAHDAPAWTLPDDGPVFL